MSAAATAAGYLYASGRLRGRASKEEGQQTQKGPHPQEEGGERRRIRVKALPEAAPAAEAPEAAPAERPKRTPTVQYRTRKWKPDAA